MQLLHARSNEFEISKWLWCATGPVSGTGRPEPILVEIQVAGNFHDSCARAIKDRIANLGIIVARMIGNSICSGWMVKQRL